MKLTCSSYFGYGFKIKTSVTHEHMIKNQEHVKNTYEHFRTFKHIQGEGKEIIPTCKIHTVEKEALGRDPKSRVEKKN